MCSAPGPSGFARIDDKDGADAAHAVMHHPRHSLMVNTGPSVRDAASRGHSFTSRWASTIITVLKASFLRASAASGAYCTHDEGIVWLSAVCAASVSLTCRMIRQSLGENSGVYSSCAHSKTLRRHEQCTEFGGRRSSGGQVHSISAYAEAGHLR